MNKYIFNIENNNMIIFGDLHGDLKMLIYLLISNNIILEINKSYFDSKSCFRIPKYNKFDVNTQIINDNYNKIDDIFNGNSINDNYNYDYYYYKWEKKDFILVIMGDILADCPTKNDICKNNYNIYNEKYNYIDGPDIFLLKLILYIYKLSFNYNVNMFLLYGNHDISNNLNNLSTISKIFRKNYKDYIYQYIFKETFNLFHPFVIINNYYFSHCIIPNVNSIEELDNMYNNIKLNLNNFICNDNCIVNMNNLNINTIILAHTHQYKINIKKCFDIPIIYIDLGNSKFFDTLKNYYEKPYYESLVISDNEIFIKSINKYNIYDIKYNKL